MSAQKALLAIASALQNAARNIYETATGADAKQEHDDLILSSKAIQAAAAHITQLEAENAELKAQLAAPRGTDAQILKEQAHHD